MRLPSPARDLFAIVALAAPFVSSCALQTTFTGSPKVDGGPMACRARCTQWGLEFAGMVTMGDYSDGCVCQVPAKPLQVGAVGQAAAAAGVALQTRAQEEARRQNTAPTAAR